MEFLLLGPLEVRRADMSIPLGPRRAERCLLGLLLLETGRMISIDRLGDLLWDDHAPDNARALLQTHVSRLRSLLDPDRDGRHGVRLLGQKSGYELQTDPLAVDAFRFRALVSAGQARDSPHARAAALRAALALWRGPVLADCASDRLRDRIGTGLSELRLHAWESCVEAELEAGRHREVIADLTDLIAANPLRERLVYLLMLALYRDGRQTAALDVFREARNRIADVTGLDPGPQLTDLQARILRAEPLPANAQPQTTRMSSRTVPRQLPPDIAYFVGRAAEVAALVGQTDHVREGFAGVAAINGAGGTGKSALAVHVAHRLSALFPDGQLYIDLQGSTPGLASLSAREALQRMLRGLGVDNRGVPHSEAECTTAFRHRTSGRRILLVVDNALDAAQVKPLLPASSTCFVIVTSRAVLATLDNAMQIRLESLTEPEAVELLGRFDARALLPAQREAALGITDRCGRLPLAIRIVGARLAARPDRALSQTLLRLERQRARLGEFELDDLSVRTSISISHEHLRTHPSGRTAGEVLQGLGILTCPDMTVPMAVALTRFDEATVSRALGHLVEQQLLFIKADDRYGLHDLVRLYAREQAATKWPPRLRRQAVHRVLDFYVWNAKRAIDLMFPASTFAVDHVSEHPVHAAFTDAGEAHIWIAQELANIVTLADQAAHLSTAHAQLVVKLVRVLQSALYDRYARYAELRTLSELAISAAAKAGDVSGAANAHQGLGLALSAQGETDAAIAALLSAIELNTLASDDVGVAQSHLILSIAYRRVRRYDDSVKCLRQGVVICVSANVPRLEANLRDNLGIAYRRLGRLEEAIATHLHGLRIRQALGTELGIAASTENLGWTMLDAGRLGEAAEYFRKCAQVSANISNFMLQASALWGLSSAEHRLGHHAAAELAKRQSIDVFRNLAITEEDEAELLAADTGEIPRALRVRLE